MVDSLGCKLNQAEAELLARQFAEIGCRLVASPAEADIYILNTCTVTHVADRKSRHLLRLAHRRRPDALLVATGCYAQRAPDELAQLDGVSLVVGNQGKPNLRRMLAESGYISSPVVDEEEGSLVPTKTRALVKVQDGCAAGCAYCIVPLVRGGERIRSADDIVTEIGQRTAEGYREVVLTGVKIGSYLDNGMDLRGLLNRILLETGIERLRLSSLQPPDIRPELIALWDDPRLCPHFHLCLQSGSDNVLRRMKRRYLTADFERAVSLVRNHMPEVAITTDVMVGFPGETEAEFADSYRFCLRMEFSRIHVFSYSRRSGTEAAELPGQVSDRIKQERSRLMLKLAEESRYHYHQQFLGQTLPVLFEQSANGVWSGLSANYIKVYTGSSEDLGNKLVPVKLVELSEDGMWGEKAISSR
jgi:threonylcarbamoyladenosine tRNA methylthiotransferase MtaB